MQQSQLPNFYLVQQQLNTIRNELKCQLDAISHPQLNMSEEVIDMACTTIDQIIASLPSESQLSVLSKNNLPAQQKRQAILNYKGPSQVVNDFKIDIQKTKQESLNTYYVYTLLNLPNLKKIEQDIIQGDTLESWKIKNTSTSVKKADVNMLRNDYRQYLKQKQIEKQKLNITKNIPNPTNVLQEEDLLIYLTFYQSYAKEKQNQFICHNSNLLTELQDKFSCLIYQLSQKDHKSGSFFFINQTFYNDTRFGRQNISQQIISTAKKNDVQYNYYSMQNTRLKNLRVEVGKPYLWRHLKGCDHMIVFNQYRLYDSTIDLKYKEQYPINIFQKKINKRKCEGCKRFNAKIASHTDKNKNGENLYLCLQCHQHIHLQDAEGGDIKLPKYNKINITKYIHQ